MKKKKQKRTASLTTRSGESRRALGQRSRNKGLCLFSSQVSGADLYFEADSSLTRPECDRCVNPWAFWIKRAVHFFPTHTHKNSQTLKKRPILSLSLAFLKSIYLFLMPRWVSCVWRPPGSQTMWCDPGDGGADVGREERRGGPVMEKGLRGPEVSRGVWEMTVAALGGLSPFH